MNKSVIDPIDRQILSILMENDKVSYAVIAKKLFVSPGTVHVRLKKMEESGIIKGHQMMVDYGKLGYDVTAFLGIYLQKSSMYEQVMHEFKQIEEMVGAHYTTGNYSIFAKIVCRDTNHLKEVLHDKIQKIEGIQRTETFISLEEGIDRPLTLSV